MSESNLELWNSVEKTDPKHTKKTKLGAMSITAIDPQYQRKSATEVFGPFGTGWTVVGEQFSTETFKDDTVLGNYSARLNYVYKGEEGGLPICSNVKVAYTTSTGKYKVDDEWMKKAATDALTKGLSTLGFNSDVFLGLFDDNKYVKQREAEEKKKATPPKKSAKDKALEAIAAVKTVAELDDKVRQFEEYNEKRAGFYDDVLKMHVEGKRKALQHDD